MEDVAAILTQLAVLQKTDTAMQAMETEKAEVSVKIKEMQDTIQANKAEFEAKKKKLDEARKAKVMIELDIKGKEADIKKKEEQSALIKTNEAYKALQDEINAMRREIKSLEEKELVVMEDEDASHKWVKEQEVAMKKQEADINAEIVKIEADVKAKDALIALEKVKRDAEASKISAAWHLKYEKIRKNKNGMALAQVVLDNKNNGICSGCRMTVRAQKVIEIKKMKEIFICENCARMLYI
jgi:predicted  nucleic acid-binding Zn-ribbon protein